MVESLDTCVVGYLNLTDTVEIGMAPSVPRTSLDSSTVAERLCHTVVDLGCSIGPVPKGIEFDSPSHHLPVGQQR